MVRCVGAVPSSGGLRFAEWPTSHGGNGPVFTRPGPMGDCGPEFDFTASLRNPFLSQPSVPSLEPAVIGRSSWRRLLPRSIRGKLLLAFIIMTAITGGLGLWCILQVKALSRINIETYDGPLMAINYARSADTTFEQLCNIALGPDIAAAVAEGAEDPTESFFGDLDVVEQRASSEAAVADVQRVRDLAKRWFAMKHAAEKASSPGLVHQAEDHLADQVRDAFEHLVEQTVDDGFANRRRAMLVSSRSQVLSLVVTGLALLLSMLMTVLLARRVVRPLSAATTVANRIAAGELETPIPPGGPDEAGLLLSSLTVMQRRIREMVEAEASRRRSAQGRLIEALESSTEAMLLLDRRGFVLMANTRAATILGGLAAHLRDGIAFADLFPPSEGENWSARLSTPGEVMLPDGRWLAIRREETVDGGSFLILSDITLRKEYEQKLHSAAYQDPLTGLHNRSYLFGHFDGDAVRAAAGSRPALFIVNIDRFRQINGAYGTRIGDEALKRVAARLQLVIGPGDVCARINGDEFVIWIADSDAERAEVVMARVLAGFSAPVAIEDTSLPLHLSVGAALADGTGWTGHDLLRDARVALDQAKHLGGTQGALFNDVLREQSRVRTRIELDLPQAIKTRQIYLDYQPLIHLGSGKVGGVEALARWRHPDFGQIPPVRFIPVAEESGTIVELGHFVLDEATMQAASWFDGGHIDDDFTVAVNLSPRQLANPRGARHILDYLDRQGGNARRLKLEITEGVLLQDPVAMLTLLQAFKERGVELSLDDFGTGFSSLSYLHKFPFDVLKIDRSFVQDIETDADAFRLVRTIIELGQDLGLRIVAEGVETARQAEHLTALGCDYGQGYYFSRPIAPEAATAYMADRNRLVAVGGGV
jgi:diguanylate cyclase (GGDEF)-like protein